jgi:hypothetical protein
MDFHRWCLEQKLKEINNNYITCMNVQNWDKRSITSSISLPLLSVIFVFIFTGKSVDIVTVILVKPLFASITKSTIITDIACLSVGVWIVWKFIRRAITGVRLSILLQSYIISFSIIFLYIRLVRPAPFIYTHFDIPFLAGRDLTDIFLAPLLGVICYYLVYCGRLYGKNTANGESQRGFYTDAPIAFNENNDLLKRYGYVLDLKNKILATKATNQSFAIAIIGKWGAGKTSFIKTLENALKSDTDVIQFRFNPWVTGGSENITSLFFNDLAANLSKYDESLKREILDYTRELLQSADIGSNGIIKTLFSVFYKDLGWNERFDLINESIRRLKKKVVVYIDDVDRLDKNEVVEILRIVRNTANFSNVFFIVAFDKTYVISSINNALIGDSENYIEKIFQLEYYLPIGSDKEMLELQLYKELEAVLDDSGRAQLLEMRNAPIAGFNKETLPYLEGYIGSLRDIKRYINVFLLNYDYIKDNIYFPDYVGMCVVRLKYPEVYQLLYIERDQYFTSLRQNGSIDEYTGRFSLAFESEDRSDPVNTRLYKELATEHARYAINKKDVLAVVMLVESIFVNSGHGSLLSFHRRLKNNHMSVVNVDCFDRYFDLSMEGRLDQREFESALQYDLENFKSLIKKWNSVRIEASDLQIKLENLNVAKLDGVSFFEKAIKGIIYFANLRLPSNSYEINRFSTENLYDKLVGKDEEKGKVLKRFYDGDEEKYRNFVRELFYLRSEGDKLSFMYDFAMQIIIQYPDSFVLKHGELKSVIKESFLTFVASPGMDFDQIWVLYSQVIREFIDKSKSAKFWVPIEEGIEMTDAFRAYILEKGFNEYLSSIILKNRSMGGYGLNYWIETFFGSKDYFEEALEERKLDPVVEEFVRFYKQCKDNGYGFIDFSFELLSPWGDVVDKKMK